MNKRNKEETKRNIIAAAEKIFCEKGFLNASTLHIAKKAGVAHGTVFFHFPNKADLIIETIYSILHELAISLDKEARSTKNIKKLCNIYLKEVENKSNFYQIIAKELPLLPIEVQRTVFASLSGFSVHFVEVIQDKQNFKKAYKFPPKIAMFYWFGLVNYLYSYSELLGTKKLKRKEKLEIIEFFIRAIIK